VVVLTNSATSVASVTGSWIPWGPYKANNLWYSALFTATSAGPTVKVQGALTTGSTKAWLSFASIGSTATVKYKVASTSAAVFSMIRVLSTHMARSTGATDNTVTVTLAAVN